MSRIEFEVGKTVVRLVRGDITEIAVDSIVNAANSSLMGGGGVDGAIHRKGGLTILQECKRIRDTQFPIGLPPGRAVITSAGNLKAKSVIDCPPEMKQICRAIKKAFSPKFVRFCKTVDNPYGKNNTAKKIYRAIKSNINSPQSIKKNFYTVGEK